MLRCGELWCRAEGRPVLVEVLAELSKRRRQAGKRSDLRCLKKEKEEEGQSLHGESV
jgi:hypothetical protein